MTTFIDSSVAHAALSCDVLANPSFNDSDRCGELLKHDKGWVYGTSTRATPNTPGVQHFIHHLASTGLAGLVLASGAMSSNQSGEGKAWKQGTFATVLTHSARNEHLA